MRLKKAKCASCGREGVATVICHGDEDARKVGSGAVKFDLINWGAGEYRCDECSAGVIQEATRRGLENFGLVVA